MDEKVFGNGMYTINKDFDVIYYNEKAKELFPAITKGEKCYKVIGGFDTHCKFCPLINKENNIKVFFNEVHKTWISAHFAKNNDKELGYYTVFLTSSVEDVKLQRDDIKYSKMMLALSNKNYISSCLIYLDNGRIKRYHCEEEQIVEDKINCRWNDYLETLVSYIDDEESKKMVYDKACLEALNDHFVGDEWRLNFESRINSPNNELRPIEIVYRILEIDKRKVCLSYTTLNLDLVNQRLIARHNEFSNMLVNALADAYAFILKVDLETHEAKWLEVNDDGFYENVFPGGWNLLGPQLHSLVHMDDHEKMLSYFSDELYDFPKGIVIVDQYRTTYDRHVNKPNIDGNYSWYTCYIRVFEENGHRVASILNVDNTHFIQKESDQSKLLGEYASVAKALTNNFDIILCVDTNDFNKVKIFKLSKEFEEKFGKNLYECSSYEQLMRDYSETLVFDDEKEDFKKQTKLFNVMRKIEHDGIFVYTFKCKLDGKINNYRITASIDGNLEESHYVFGFECINNIVELENRACIDNLTQIYNRDGLFKFLYQMKDNFDRRKNHYLLLIDVNHFKQINDLHGHVEGDRALVRVANALTLVSTKYKGFVSRHGGDEFVMLLSIENSQNIDDICDEINKTLYIENKKALVPYELNLTIGVAKYDQSIKSFDKLITLADIDLYKKKN